jgi:hypothetical protein
MGYVNPRGRIAKWWLRNLPAKLAVLIGTLAATAGFFGVVHSHPLLASPASTSPDTSAAATSPVGPAVPTPSLNNNTAPRRVPTPVPVARRSRRS